MTTFYRPSNFLFLAIAFSFLFSQILQAQPLTRFVLSSEQQAVQLPVSVDNSKSDALPPVYSQLYFPNCEQASSIYHGFAYEYNNLMHLSGKDTACQYPANFAFNFYNQNTQQGVSFFDSFKILYEAGQPNHKEFGLDHSVGGLHWMTGEANWESAMTRRIERLYTFDVTTESGIKTLKHWLYNHGDGSSYGGVAVFTFGISSSFITLADSCPLNYIPCIKSFGGSFSHAMLIVGYHDSTFFDLNNDGKITTDVDLNKDGQIDLRDSEYGSWIALNSYSEDWGYQGLVQLPYCLSAWEYLQYGFCNGEAYGMVPRANHSSLTMTFKINYNQRDKLSMKVGFNEDQEAEWPSQTMDIAILNNVGGAHHMQGNDELLEERNIEMAADITPLYSLMPAGKAVKFFVILDENDPESQGNGFLRGWRVKENGEVVCQRDDSLAICNNSCTVSSELVTLRSASDMEILNDSIISLLPNDSITINMLAKGGEKPYHWTIKPSFSVNYFKEAPLPSPRTYLEPTSINESVRKIKLPFLFPFLEETYDSIFVWANGMVTFSASNYQYAYVQDVKNLFSKRCCLVSGYNTVFRESFEGSDSVFYSLTDSSYSIIWSLPSMNSTQKKYSGLTLYSSGKIDFIRPEVSFSELGDYYQGYSTGFPDGQFISSYHSIPVSDSRLMSVSSVSNNIFSKLTIDGQLVIKPRKKNCTQPLVVVLHDAKGLRKEKKFHLVQSLLSSVDWKPSRSESEEMARIMLKNVSSRDITNARICLKADQPNITITPAYVDVALIAAGQQITMNPDFRVQYGSTTAFCETSTFSIIVISEGDTFQQVTHHKPNLVNCKLFSVYVDDQADQAIERGEMADVILSFVNSGSGRGREISATVTSLVEGCSIELLDESLKYDLEPYGSFQFRCRAHISSAFDFNLIPLVKVELTDGYTEFFNQRVEIPTARTAPLILNLAKSDASSDSLEKYMRECGFIPRVRTLKSLENHLVGEKNVFVLTGMFGQSYALQEADILNLNTFMSLGGKIYLEGQDYWGKVGNNTFGSYFGVTSTYGITRYDSLIGGCAITQGLKFNLSLPHPPTSFTVKVIEGTSSLLSVAGVEEKTSAFYKKSDKNVAIGSVYDIAHLVEQKKGDTKRYVQRILDLMGFDTLNMTANFYTSDRTVKVTDTVKLINCSVGSSVTPEWICQGASVIKSLEDTIWVVYSLPGSYPVKLTISNGDQSKSLQKDGYITVLSNDGVIEPVGKQYTVYPVPASDRITISENEVGERAVRVRLYSIDGQEILRQDNLMIDRSHEIDVSTLKSGTYLLVIESGKSISSYPVVILR